MSVKPFFGMPHPANCARCKRIGADPHSNARSSGPYVASKPLEMLEAGILAEHLPNNRLQTRASSATKKVVT